MQRKNTDKITMKALFDDACRLIQRFDELGINQFNKEFNNVFSDVIGMNELARITKKNDYLDCILVQPKHHELVQRMVITHKVILDSEKRKNQIKSSESKLVLNQYLNDQVKNVTHMTKNHHGGNGNLSNDAYIIINQTLRVIDACPISLFDQRNPIKEISESIIPILDKRAKEIEGNLIELGINITPYTDILDLYKNAIEYFKLFYDGVIGPNTKNKYFTLTDNEGKNTNYTCEQYLSFISSQTDSLELLINELKKQTQQIEYKFNKAIERCINSDEFRKNKNNKIYIDYIHNKFKGFIDSIKHHHDKQREHHYVQFLMTDIDIQAFLKDLANPSQFIVKLESKLKGTDTIKLDHGVEQRFIKSVNGYFEKIAITTRKLKSHCPKNNNKWSETKEAYFKQSNELLEKLYSVLKTKDTKQFEEQIKPECDTFLLDIQNQFILINEFYKNVSHDTLKKEKLKADALEYLNQEQNKSYKPISDFHSSVSNTELSEHINGSHSSLLNSIQRNKEKIKSMKIINTNESVEDFNNTISSCLEEVSGNIKELTELSHDCIQSVHLTNTLKSDEELARQIENEEIKFIEDENIRRNEQLKSDEKLALELHQSSQQDNVSINEPQVELKKVVSDTSKLTLSNNNMFNCTSPLPTTRDLKYYYSGMNFKK